MYLTGFLWSANEITTRSARWVPERWACGSDELLMIPKGSAGSPGRPRGRTSLALGTCQVFLTAPGPELSQETLLAGSRLLYWVLANYCPDQERKQRGTHGRKGQGWGEARLTPH